MLFTTLSLALVPQQPAGAPSNAAPPTVAPASATPIVVALTPHAPRDGETMQWSPKGATVALTADGTALRGELTLGPAGASPVRVELTRRSADGQYDQLALDLDRDGTFTTNERLATTAKENRGKWWSSFEAVLTVPFPAGRDPGAVATTIPYPLSLWFVADPQQPDAAPALRWSRRGWHEGECTVDGRPAHVLVTEMQMDGVFTAADAWQLARDRKDLRRDSRSLATHAWLDGRAYRMSALSPDGRTITFEPFDPGVSEAEEKARADTMRADREAKRAAAPLPFGKDLTAALAEATRTRKRVFVDFETTWCGPCKQMDQWVYTAADVVAAAAAGDVIAVKLDGDEQRDAVARYEVKGYPTLLLLDADGKVVRREVGYQSVAAMVRFLAK